MLVKQRGDTMVEVMVAFAIFAMAAVSAIAIMNRGIAMTQRSLEITLVREQIDSQADLLRYARDNNLSIWNDIASSSVSPTLAVTTPRTDCPASAADMPPGSFYIYPNQSALERVVLRSSSGNVYQPAETYARVANDARVSHGMWVQPVRVDSTTYDMYINACWDTVASDTPITLRTIVRLYES